MDGDSKKQSDESSRTDEFESPDSDRRLIENIAWKLNYFCPPRASNREIWREICRIVNENAEMKDRLNRIRRVMEED